MKKIILNLRKFSGAQLIVLARKLIVAISDNRYFKDAAPVLKKLGDATEEYWELVNAKPISPGKFYTINVNNLKQELILRIKQTVYYVQSVVYDNELKESGKIITSAGLQFKKPMQRKNVFFTVKCGDLPGSIKAKCKRKPNTAYLFQITDDITNKNNWKEAAFSTKCKADISGLKYDSRYWVRFASIKGQVQSEFSEALSVIVR